MTFSRLDHVRRIKNRKPHHSTAGASLPSRKPDRSINPEKDLIRVLGVVQDGRVIWNDGRETSAVHDR